MLNCCWRYKDDLLMDLLYLQSTKPVSIVLFSPHHPLSSPTHNVCPPPPFPLHDLCCLAPPANGNLLFLSRDRPSWCVALRLCLLLHQILPQLENSTLVEVVDLSSGWVIR